MADDGPSALPPGHSRLERLRRLMWPAGLPARLLILTVLFVGMAELLIMAPALASFQERWLLDRVRMAELATVAFDAAPDQMLPGAMRDQLKDGAGVILVAVNRRGVNSRLMAPDVMPETYLIDLRSQNFAEWLAAPFRALFDGKARFVTVMAEPRFLSDAVWVNIVAPDDDLKGQLRGYFARLLAFGLFIAAVAGALVYLSLDLLLVRPMQRITVSMEHYRADPDDPEVHIDPSGRRDEIGRAEQELSLMQADLRAALNSRARLAALGQAVAKINHDLRNMLTSAQIASERLALSGDPVVAKAMPRLERALDRAVRLASDVLAYGKSEEAAPTKSPVAIQAALEAAAEDARLPGSGVRLTSTLKTADRVSADPDQLHRILVNLLKNARQAVQGSPERDGRGRIVVSLERREAASVLRIADDGPGIPERALQNLFQPFAASGRPGGTGLGLAIARELAQGHAGDLVLVSTGPDGTAFELTLPGVVEPKRKG